MFVYIGYIDIFINNQSIVSSVAGYYSVGGAGRAGERNTTLFILT